MAETGKEDRHAQHLQSSGRLSGNAVIACDDREDQRRKQDAATASASQPTHPGSPTMGAGMRLFTTSDLPAGRTSGAPENRQY